MLTHTLNQEGGFCFIGVSLGLFDVELELLASIRFAAGPLELLASGLNGPGPSLACATGWWLWGRFFGCCWFWWFWESCCNILI